MQPVKVEIRESGGRGQFWRGGAPYDVRGVGLGVDAPDLDAMMRALKRSGGNSFRTWHVGDGAFLDLAHELGLTVALCLDIKRERHGFDYGDPTAVRRQLEEARQIVLRHRNHPALLAWVIGNELNLGYEDPRVYDAVNDISQMIHELDPNHPTTSTTAGMNVDLARDISERAADLDFISIQVYGGLFDLPEALAQIDLGKPIVISEWGTIGHWEVPTTTWGAPIELNSSAKAQTYKRGHDTVLSRLGGDLLGSYAFLWGQKQERTPTWYGLFVDGLRTEAVDVLQTIWKGATPENQAPTVDDILLDAKRASDSVRLRSGQVYTAQVKAADADDDALRFRWQVMDESEATQAGGDAEAVPEDESQMIVQVQGDRVQIRAPDRSGAYRLFVYIYDDKGGIAHANLPFYVEFGDNR